MSIIQAFKEERRRVSPMGHRNNRVDDGEETNVKAKILDLTKLKDLVDRVITHHKTTVEDAGDFRKFTQVWDVNLGNILGYVDEPTWIFMIESYIEWCIDCKTAIQPNGKWEIYGYEILQERRIRRENHTVGKKTDGKADVLELKTPYDVLCIGIQFVDTKNELDMAYEMGRPSTRKDSFDPRMMQEMMKNVAPVVDEKQQQKLEAQEAKLAEQSKVINQLKNEQKRAAAEQQKTNELMAALLSEIKEQKSGRSASTRKK